MYLYGKHGRFHVHLSLGLLMVIPSASTFCHQLYPLQECNQRAGEMEAGDGHTRLTEAECPSQHWPSQVQRHSHPTQLSAHEAKQIIIKSISSTFKGTERNFSQSINKLSGKLWRKVDGQLVRNSVEVTRDKHLHHSLPAFNLQLFTRWVIMSKWIPFLRVLFKTEIVWVAEN